jgi:hypothetical protein
MVDAVVACLLSGPLKPCHKDLMTRYPSFDVLCTLFGHFGPQGMKAANWHSKGRSGSSVV